MPSITLTRTDRNTCFSHTFADHGNTPYSQQLTKSFLLNLVKSKGHTQQHNWLVSYAFGLWIGGIAHVQVCDRPSKNGRGRVRHVNQTWARTVCNPLNAPFFVTGLCEARLGRFRSDLLMYKTGSSELQWNQRLGRIATTVVHQCPHVFRTGELRTADALMDLYRL